MQSNTTLLAPQAKNPPPSQWGQELGAADLRGGSYLVAEPASLGGRDALGYGSAGEKSCGNEEGGGEAEEREASATPPHRLHRVRARGRAGPGREEECGRGSQPKYSPSLELTTAEPETMRKLVTTSRKIELPHRQIPIRAILLIIHSLLAASAIHLLLAAFVLLFSPYPSVPHAIILRRGPFCSLRDEDKASLSISSCPFNPLSSPLFCSLLHAAPPLHATPRLCSLRPASTPRVRWHLLRDVLSSSPSGTAGVALCPPSVDGPYRKPLQYEPPFLLHLQEEGS
nr:unnamed protein product [Digitaria exilis]